MDTSMSALTRTMENIARAFEEYKSVNDQRLDAVKHGNESLAAELKEKLGRIESDISQFSKLKSQIEAEQKLQRERIEELEARASTPRKSPADKIADEYKSTFIDWIRHKGNSSRHEEKLQELQRKALEYKTAEQKAVTIASSAGGGYAVPEEIAREIERMELLYSPVRSLVKVVRSGTSDYKELVNLRGATSGWVGESDSRTETATPTLRERTPTHGELYALPEASEWSLDDIFFDVENWLVDEAAQGFAIAEATAVLTGDGQQKPTGMFNTTPVTTPDWSSPLRPAGAYQYIESVSMQSPAVAEIHPDKLIELVYTLNSAYRTNAVWIMNSLTQGRIRMLKDGNGQYLWQPGLQAGQPDRLLGYPVSTWEQMPDIGANAFPVGFGDWKRAYVLNDRVGLRITRDDVTTKGFVKFYIRRREGGTVLNNDAAKFLRTTV